MLCHTVHGKVISAINEMHNKDATPNPNVNKVEKKETGKKNKIGRSSQLYSIKINKKIK